MRKGVRSFRPWYLLAVGIALTAAGVWILRAHHARIDRGLIDAIEQGKPDSLRRLIEAGARVNQPVTDRIVKPTPATYFRNALHGVLRGKRRARTTPLMLAVSSGSDTATQLLLEHGARVDARDEYGFTALMMAISVHHTDIVRMLLAHGADPNAANDLDMPPLLWAMMMHQPDCAMALLDAGADPNASDADGMPALYLAVLEGEDRVVEMLLARGARPGAVFKGCAAMQLASAERDRDVMQELHRRGVALPQKPAATHAPRQPEKAKRNAGAPQKHRAGQKK